MSDVPTGDEFDDEAPTAIWRAPSEEGDDTPTRLHEPPAMPVRPALALPPMPKATRLQPLALDDTIRRRGIHERCERPPPWRGRGVGVRWVAVFVGVAFLAVVIAVITALV